jgi:hypothetical protein
MFEYDLNDHILMVGHFLMVMNLAETFNYCCSVQIERAEFCIAGGAELGNC